MATIDTLNNVDALIAKSTEAEAKINLLVRQHDDRSDHGPVWTARAVMRFGKHQNKPYCKGGCGGGSNTITLLGLTAAQGMTPANKWHGPSQLLH